MSVPLIPRLKEIVYRNGLPLRVGQRADLMPPVRRNVNNVTRVDPTHGGSDLSVFRIMVIVGGAHVNGAVAVVAVRCLGLVGERGTLEGQMTGGVVEMGLRGRRGGRRGGGKGGVHTLPVRTVRTLDLTNRLVFEY